MENRVSLNMSATDSHLFWGAPRLFRYSWGFFCLLCTRWSNNENSGMGYKYRGLFVKFSASITTTLLHKYLIQIQPRVPLRLGLSSMLGGRTQPLPSSLE